VGSVSANQSIRKLERIKRPISDSVSSRVKKVKILLVAGARPNFMKVAPVYFELKKYPQFKPIIVHTGQHYDKEMSELFFRDLKLPKPDIYLGVGSGTHAEQTSKIMIEFEKVCMKVKPHLVIVVGDVNSTIACALTSAKLLIPVAHVEAGLRSFDRTMPEEINRLLTDQISDFLFTTCEDANRNLLNEGIPADKIFFVGNVMIDTLKKHLQISRKLHIREKLDLRDIDYGILTLHRPSNVDDVNTLQRIMEGVSRVSRRLPIIFPAHPRTKKKLENIEFLKYKPHLKQGCILTPPLGYLEFLSLMANAKLVMTDSGGIQEETTILDISCLTLRNNTERPITITHGTNTLVGTEPDKIVQEAISIIKKKPNRQKRPKRPKYWDGNAAKRLVKIITKFSPLTFSK